ncbi:surp module domain-containing protein, putative [Eimeria tenella]|uniref:Surp module domain-containing protein, putative n=1 Tax=Eimeria tenella TaxID=5802 RepID=U6L011_EIMTE|nr:surp module domain-containing protein, putative [Eimeria tenella]CDJ42513.1 surp module domain-containing protein, putative [Eimeria tenella]|eukprot:XP_013233263.1 surp module domain-containing protein, putative [Eimeria tenella]
MSAAVEPTQRPSGSPTGPGASGASGVGTSDVGAPGTPHPDLIFPPADMRGVIEKTAQFVAKNGAEFESRVLREQSATKFGFLLPNNPYHAFYKLKVREFTTGEAAPTPQVPQAIRDMQQKQQQEKQQQQQLLMLTQIGESEKEANKEQIEPPPPHQFVLQHPWVAPIDLDIIRCAAQFVARNGQKFLAGLAQREQQNPQFAFLKPSHHLFSFFASLVDAYTKCLLPQKEMLESIKETAGNRQALLARVRRRMMYERQQLQQRKEKETKTQEERRLMMSLEWTDFHVVETIDFTEEDERLPLAAPIDFKSIPKELPKALLAEDGTAADGLAEEGDKVDSIAKLIEGADADQDDEAMETEDEEETAKQAIDKRQATAGSADAAEAAERAAAEKQQELPPAPAAPLRVVKGYVRTKKRQAATGASSGFQRCPITGQLIPADQMTNHLRILLLDPKWKEQKDRFLEKAQAESAFAPLEDVEGYLAQFVAKRPDLFGSVDDHARLEAEAEVDPLRAEATVAAVGVSGEAPEAKRQRVDSTPSAPAAAADGVPSLLLLTVVCREGEGLEAQEAQVEVDRSLTGAQLKQSLLDAGIGAETLRARDLQLSTSVDGPAMLDHLTLVEAGIRSPESRLYLSVVSR